MDSPLVSVCIANYNGSAILSACIESVLAQDGGFLVEILVHDDASTDDSADVVARDYPGVRLIRSGNNVGFCIANNRMVAEAQGEFILLLNNDAELLPDALRVLLEESRSLGKSAILSVPQYDHGSGDLIDRGCLLDPFFNPVPNLDPNRQDVAMVIGACLWIPISLWQELGGFPEWFGSLAEDLYLCCRARLAGYPVRAVARSGYRHHVGAQFGGGRMREGKLSTTFRRRALTERNKTFVMVMAFPPLLMPVMLTLHLLVLLLEGGCLSLVKWQRTYLTEIYLPVFGALVTRSKELRKGRRACMHNRLLSSVDFLVAFDPTPYKLRMLFKYGLPEAK